MTWWQIYRKCRRCGEETNALAMDMEHPDIEIAKAARGDHPNAPPVSTHQCSDGGYGVCDLVGARPEPPATA